MTIALISPKGVGMGRAEENTQTANLYSKLAAVDHRIHGEALFRYNRIP